MSQGFQNYCNEGENCPPSPFLGGNNHILRPKQKHRPLSYMQVDPIHVQSASIILIWLALTYLISTKLVMFNGQTLYHLINIHEQD